MSEVQLTPSIDERRFQPANPGRPAEASMAEAVLLDRCKDGDSRAWDQLIHRYEKSVYKFAFSLCRNSEEAGDIAGQVFLRLYQNLGSFRSEASFTSWLFRIVRNTYLDLCVRPAHRNHVSLDRDPGVPGELPLGNYLADSSPDPEAICIGNDTQEMLSNAIRHLPAYQRQVLKMYHTEGRSYQEIAETTGLAIGTVKSRLNRARTMLRERLSPDQQEVLVH